MWEGNLNPEIRNISNATVMLINSILEGIDAYSKRCNGIDST